MSFFGSIRLPVRRWTVTGAAGFIGSNLVESLLALGQEVTGLDSFASGSRSNLEDALRPLTEEERSRFTFVEGDIRSPEACGAACRGTWAILHHAALVSVPLSMEQPRLTLEVNVGGFGNILEASRRNGCRVVFASSSAVYGDAAGLPKRESSPLAPQSPYGLSKRENEEWASLYWKCYGVPTVGLRYFNVYGPRQDPGGAYAAVIAAWADAVSAGRAGTVYGDGTASRDFCFVADVVQANILAASAGEEAFGQVFNVASGSPVSLLELYGRIQEAAGRPGAAAAPRFAPPRQGDILHSSADISKAREVLRYAPEFSLGEGLSLLFKRRNAGTEGPLRG